MIQHINSHRHALFFALLACGYAVAQPQPIALEPIVVQGSTNAGYGVANVSGATGMALSQREATQSISVINTQQLTDQNLPTLDRAVQQATGVSQQIWGSNRAGYNFLFARGSRIDNVRLDGLPVNAALADMGNLSSSAYEQVEVVRGVSGLLDGSGDTGASVTLVRKRPNLSVPSGLSVGIGMRKQYVLSADASAALNEQGTLRGRAVLATEGGDSWRQRESSHAHSLYGVLSYDFGEQTELSVGVHWQSAREDASASHSFATYDSAGYATDLGLHDNPAPNWAYSRTHSLNLFADVTHHFNADWQGKLAYNYNRSTWDHPYGVAGVLSIEHDSNAADIFTGYWQSNPHTHSVSATIDGRYKLFGREHQLIAGINGLDYDNKNASGGRALGKIDDIHRFSKEGEYPRPDSYAQHIYRGSGEWQMGVFAATRMQVSDDLALTVGGRYSHNHQDNIDRFSGAQSSVEHNRFTPYLGVVYDFTPNLSAYAGYSSLFIPQSEKDHSGDYLSPVIGSNIEGGFKGEWFDGRLNASLAVYEARKDHLAIRDGQHADGQPYYRAADKTKTRGWELDISGEIVQGWAIRGGYSQTLIRDSNGERINTDTTPRHTVKLFTTYTLPNSADKWQVGGGLRWQSETHVAKPLGRFPDEATKQRAKDNARQPVYSIVDLMARYQINDSANITLNANNVFNTVYRTQADRHSYGEPRSVLATLRYDF